MYMCSYATITIVMHHTLYGNVDKKEITCTCTCKVMRNTTFLSIVNVQ